MGGKRLDGRAAVRSGCDLILVFDTLSQEQTPGSPCDNDWVDICGEIKRWVSGTASNPGSVRVSQQVALPTNIKLKHSNAFHPDVERGTSSFTKDPVEWGSVESRFTN